MFNEGGSIITWLISDEARKHRAFREVWVAYLLGGLYLLLGLYTEISEQNYSVLYDAQQKWNFVQQNIYSYGATLTAFLLAVGLPRLVCCEREYRTDDLVGTAALGRRCTWRAKTAFTVLYCAVVVFIIGAASLLVNGGAFGFEGALSSVAGCVYFADTALPPMSNLAYCAIQYGFLFLGALYFAGFILIVAALTRRTALSLFLCGGSYLLFFAYSAVGPQLPEFLRVPIDALYRFGFGGYLLQESYSWVFPYLWSDVWKPVLLGIGMILLEFFLFWRIWRRKAKA